MERSFLLLIFSTFLLAQDPFYYWAKITTQNNVVTNEEFFVSPIMNREKLAYLKPISLCKLSHKKQKNQTTFTYLDTFKSDLFDCFLNQSVKIYTNDSYKLRLANTKTHIAIHPTLFTVEFKEDFATIYLFKEDK